MFPHRKFKIADHELGLKFVDGRFADVLPAGEHREFDPLRRVTVETVNLRDVFFRHPQIDVLAKAFRNRGALAHVFDLADFQRAFVFVDGRFERMLGPGTHMLWVALRNVRVEFADMREAVFASAELPRVVQSGGFEDFATVLDLADTQRALVWVNGRFLKALKPGLFLLWKGLQDVRVEVLDATGVKLTHRQLPAIVNSPGAHGVLQLLVVEPGQVGLWFQDGTFTAELKPDVHAFWTGVGRSTFKLAELREQAMDVAGQEIMTRDHVTLRLNATLAFRVADALRSVSAVNDANAALYREAQLALRAVIGGRELDALLTEKDAVAAELQAIVAGKAAAMGLEVISLGIRDIILPGEMRELLNKVTEARKAAEASLITRREETAAARMQANTARILEGNPVLMKLRELEVLEKVAGKTNLKVVLGEQGGLTEKVMKLL